MRKIGLRMIIILALTLVFSLSFTGFIIFDQYSVSKRGQESLVEEARLFADAMDAVWKFMDFAQNRYNDDSEEFYQESNLYCAIVGKSVGAIFSADNDYKIRYTNFNPRNILDTPDDFETKAMTVFKNNPSTREYYGIAEFDGQDVFRYVQALEVEESCLDCHGDPVGELDVTGHEKEGWTLTSMGGAISIIMPLDFYDSAIRDSTRNDLFYVIVNTTIVFSLIFLSITFFILRPLDRIKESVGQLRQGEFAPISTEGYQAREINELIEGFNDMAKDLKSSYLSLEEQVDSRTQQLIQANETLEQLNDRLVQEVKYKSDFLSMVSHELRTPLTSILVLAQLHKEEAATRHNVKLQRAWVEIEKNCHSLLGMINNMLGIARSDAGTEQVNLDFMDLGDVVSSLKTTVLPIAQSTGVSFTSQIDSDVPLVRGDFEKTQRMLENLAHNAIKFTPEGGQVKLQIQYDKKTDSVLIRMADTGMGIAQEDQERIFDRFVQLDSGITRRFNGSGLGLALVRDYATMQGYEVSVKSVLGEGSTFVIRIPSEALVIQGSEGEKADDE